jgi:hypothetical protein
MKVEIFDFSVDYLKKITKLDKEYDNRSHKLKKGEVIEPDIHESNEWIILRGGECEIIIGKESRKFHLSSYDWTVVFVPRKKRHSLIALSDIYYHVLRDKPAR